MAQVTALVAYLLAVLLDAAALLLALDWLAHALPGAGLNPVRRVLFKALKPLLALSDRYFSWRQGPFDSRGLLPAFFLVALSRYGVPWLVILSYSLRP